MDTNNTKYDTNPLDPDVERKSSEEWGQPGPTQTQRVGGGTQQIGNQSESSRRNVYSEAPTKHFDSPTSEAPYPSVFIPPTYAPPSQQPINNVYQSPATPSPSRPVAGLGISEKWVTTLAYAPFYVGLVVSLIELFLVPRKEVRVRFHASQGLALQIAFLIVHTFFGVISTITGSSLGEVLFKTAAFVFLIISMIRVCRGEPHRIAPLAEPAQWFNEHIEPRNQA